MSRTRMRTKKKYRFTNDLYVFLVVVHIILGVFINQIPGFSKLYFALVCAFFIINIIIALPKDKTMWVLFGCAYIAAAESLFRMTGGGLFYEFSKYFVILLTLMGMFYNGISGGAYPYFMYLILMVPAVLVASINLGYDLNFRTSVAFVLSGPVCLGISALYCYKKRITNQQLLQVVACMSFPIITMTTHLYLYNPSVKEVLTGTGSSFATSGGFGPNQVSTLLGLGMVALVVRVFLKSPSLFLKLFNLGLLCAVSFRALVTFSRGGVFAAIIVVGAFLWLLYWQSGYKRKQQIIGMFVLLVLGGILTWGISSSQTEGLIDNRYANKDARGREKKDISTGRLELFVHEIQGFLEHPFLGVGASGMKQERLKEDGQVVASHNEISRLLSEHGIFGVFILLLLIFRPLVFRSQHKGNVLFYAFLAFWFATINHSAMRIAAPGFIYALALLHITHEKRPVHRQQLKRKPS
ncbi:O-antigen ligase-like membrane protein [Meridianimaribacter flavus]|uniref:O-antigen ligase-like membrane protein n=2 Tax=Meridianimaribacter flavus TaxID=571115 RepID=A0ABY2G6M4_9FLAO|nr:O-antigen ligase-like membrane protein [Meridianimaribacter flavus]